MIKNLIGIGVCLAFLACPALAQTAVIDGQVAVPWGDILASSAGVIATLAASFLALALAKLPASVLAMIKTWQVDQLLEKALSYGINSVAGASKGQTLNVPVGSKVLEQALEFAVANGSDALVKWMGGPKAIEQKLVARMDLDPQAALPVK